MGIPALISVFAFAVASRTTALPTPAQSDAREAAQRIVAMVHLAAQEYALAWSHGALTAPEEAVEASGFIAQAEGAAASLPPGSGGDAARQLDEIAALLARSAPAESVAARTRALEHALTDRFGGAGEESPPASLSIAEGRRLYAASCERCHGAVGRGDGPDAAHLAPSPPPADLAALPATEAPLDYFRRITYGVPGTAMPVFGSQLDAAERWSVIAYALTFSDTLARRDPNGADAVAFREVRARLASAMALARGRDAAAAADTEFDAYLAFERVEGAVRIADDGLASRAERRFAGLRETLAAGADSLASARRYAELSSTVDSSEALLGQHQSSGELLAESFLLIVREGFEAILIVGAIMAVVLRTGAGALKRSVRWGIVLALAASIATAGALEWIVEGAASQREALEGGVMLVAAGVLFYVSYWLISKVDAQAWNRFVKEKIERAAAAGSGLALGAVAFLAVYREGFETVLFYKALYVTGGGGGAPAITAGFAAGLVVLLVAYVGIEKFGIRIPLRPFFAVTGATLYFLAFVFAGAGVKELQEGAVVPTTLVPGAPRSEFFGIYPTVQSLAVQGVILLCLVVAVVWVVLARRRRTARVAEPRLVETR